MPVISPPHELTEEELFCLEGCRTYKQYLLMRQRFEHETCTFCDIDRDLNKILWEDKYAMAWLVPDQFLRKELAYHPLFVPKRHVRFETDLTQKEVISLHKAKQYMHSRFGYEGGCTHVREGDTRLNASTVPHLHYNTFMPNQTGEVRIPVYKDPGDREANRERAKGFSHFYELGFSVEQYEAANKKT